MHPRSARNTAGALLVLYGLFSLSGTTVETDVRKVDPRLLFSDVTASPPGATEPLGAPSRTTALVPVFLRTATEDPTLPERIRNVGGDAVRISPRVHTARLPVDALRYVSNWSNIVYIEGSKRVRLMLDQSRPDILADEVQTGMSSFPPPFNTTGLKGSNVCIGIVDTGLYGGHPDFHIGGTGSSRVVHTYPSPANALVDSDGHGSHVAGIAAGNGFSSGGTYTGMAPLATLMIGKTSFTTTDIIATVDDLIGFAESRTPPLPVAINLSLGLVAGPHDGTSSFEGTINLRATEGSRRLITVAAGNEQNKGEHFRSVVGEPFGSRSISLQLLPTLSPISLDYPSHVDIWADGKFKDPDPAKRTEYDEYTVSVVFLDDSVTVPSGRSQSSPGRMINVSNRVDTNVENGATHITLIFSQALAGKRGTITLTRTRNGGTGVIDGYVDFGDGVNYGDGSFLNPDPNGNIIEPANGENVISVGSYQTKTFHGGAGSLGISSFSSFGPTRDGRVKPDVAAPGEYLYSTRSLDAPASNYDNIVSGNDNYAILRGTSMAAPHVAGIAALVWESNPALTGAQMRERLRRTADPEGASPNTTWGYGKTNALRAVRDTVASISAPARATPGVPIPLTSGNSSAGFGAAISSYAWSAPGASLTSPNLSNTTFSASTPGIYTVSLTATAGGSSGSDSRNILVNTIPTANFTVPASDNSGRPVIFRSSASDADNQALTRRWLLVSRPAGSAASITPANVDNAVFTPDEPGTYEIGLRADDGLDNSALVVHAYSTLDAPYIPPAPSPSSGGCLSIARPPGEKVDASSFVSLCFLFLPAALSGWRRIARSGQPGGSR